MKIKKLLKGLHIQLVKGPKDVEITGICSNSKLVSPGNLFVAKKGGTFDGTKFIPDAIAAGASAILSDIYNPFLRNIVQIIHPDVLFLEEKMASRFYPVSKKDFLLVGVTGTNGKTTCAYLCKYLLDHLKKPSGLIGTIEWIVGKQSFPSTRTTPEVITNYKLLHEMGESGCKAAVMEVSSHALDQNRVRGLEFDVALFTNLTPEHLDYHQTMQHYASSKSKLFSSLKKEGLRKKKAVINADSPYFEVMIKDCKVPVLLYGIDNPHAELRASNIEISPSGVAFDITFKKEKCRMISTLTGRFNVSNLLAVAGLGLALNQPLEKICEIIQTFDHVKGRLERVMNPLLLDIYVDYAHTPDALKNVLQTLNEFKTKRVITVFGCGGDRDTLKRPLMGAIAEEMSDLCIVTSDNPRTEDPRKIISEIVQGFKQKSKAMIELDRKKAIEYAINEAEKGDLILIAGKGHETYQILAHTTITFDDAEVAFLACQEKAQQRYAANTS